MTQLPTESSPPQKKKGCGCLAWFLIIFGILAGSFAVLFVIFVLMLVSAVNWFQSATTTTPENIPKVTLSPGEEEDVTRIIGELQAAKESKSEIDESITPNVFNGVLERIMDHRQPETPRAIQVSIPESGIEIKGAFPAKDPKTNAPMQGKFVNFDAKVDFEIEDGALKRLKVNSLKVADREAPFLAWIFIHFATGELVKKSRLEKDSPSNKMAAFKLVRREGDRLHVILDGAKMKEMDNNHGGKPGSNPFDIKKEKTDPLNKEF